MQKDDGVRLRHMLDAARARPHTALEKACVKLDRREEKALAEHDLRGIIDTWPEY